MDEAQDQSIKSADGRVEVSKLESAALPVHFPGMVAAWPALRLWRGESGLQRLIELAGGAHVEAMVSPAAAGELMAGDMQSLILLGTSLRDFLDGTLEARLRAAQPPGAGGLRLYLAQAPLLAASPSGGDGKHSDGGGGSGGGALAGLQPTPLAPLMHDLGVPPLLAGAGALRLSSVNLWASHAATRSSLHYDPYQNLLCVVRGRKRVWAVPPAAQPHLRPQPLCSESANHSPADLARPDLQRFPGLGAALAAAQRFELGPGDALFLPEGWWHQVDSEAGTLAVNWWWEGGVSRQLGAHMDRYYFRRLAQGLLEQQKAAALAALPRCDLMAAAAELLPDQPAGPPLPQQQQQQQQQAAAPADAQPGQPAGLAPAEQAAAVQLLAAAMAAHQQAGNDARPPPIAAAVVATLASRSPQALLDTLLQLRRQAPAEAAHLLLHGLDPAGWELLSSCFERRQEELAAEGDPTAAEEAVGAACNALYSCVPDRQALLGAILSRKQAFSRQALAAMLETELGSAL